MSYIQPGMLRQREAQMRRAELQDKLSSREGRPGFKRNAQAIRAEIARLQAQEARDERAS